jgi:hypothetical protein
MVALSSSKSPGNPVNTGSGPEGILEHHAKTVVNDQVRWTTTAIIALLTECREGFASRFLGQAVRGLDV